MVSALRGDFGSGASESCSNRFALDFENFFSGFSSQVLVDH